MAQVVDLAEYMNQGIKRLIQDAVRASLRNPRETAYLARFALAQRRSARLRTAKERQGRHIPPFLIASIASACNLHCRGCYARANRSCQDQAGPSQNGPDQTGSDQTIPNQPADGNLADSRWGEIFGEARDLGIAFILLAGGEPLLHREVLQQAARYPAILFPVFTNGTLLDESYIGLLHKSRNLLPVLSLEGPESETDARRGSGAYRTVLSVMERMQKKGILFGASITVTVRNLEAVTGEAFVRTLYDRGCRVLFYIEYVPVTAETQDLAPGDAEREYLESRQADLRAIFAPMILISFPGDEKYTGGCLAAGRGFFHINAAGGAEPCPFSPFSDISLREHSLREALESPLFRRLNQEGLLLGEHHGGCQLFNHETEVRRLLNP